jgi:hypothetical protein
MKGVPLLSCLLALLALGACKKPVLEITDKTVPPLVLSASIRDSLPQTVVKALQLDNVTGVKIQYYNGLHATYFEYQADKDLLLQLLSALPFPAAAHKADTRCHGLSAHELKILQRKISPVETEVAASFWNTDVPTLEIFECIKPPYRHTIQVTNDNRILHRVEFLG